MKKTNVEITTYGPDNQTINKRVIKLGQNKKATGKYELRGTDLAGISQSGSGKITFHEYMTSGDDAYLSNVLNTQTHLLNRKGTGKDLDVSCITQDFIDITKGKVPGVAWSRDEYRTRLTFNPDEYSLQYSEEYLSGREVKSRKVVIKK